jgi:WD40 repeat protein
MRIFRFCALFWAFVISGCSLVDDDSRSFEAYSNAEACWLNAANDFDAYVIVYDLGQGDYTLDFVSKVCRPADFQIGEPPLFVVSFTPGEGARLPDSFGIDGSLISNQILPVPSIDRIVAVFDTTAFVEHTTSAHGQLMVKNISVMEARKIDQSIDEFLRSQYAE